MTSQLILLNGFGVAVASDSVVTMGGTQRTYDTAEKVIPLSFPHRMAVLHSGSVRLHGLPYSVLVAEWASTLGEVPLRSVDQYRSSFISWLESNHQWFSKEVEFNDFLKQLGDAYSKLRKMMLSAATDEEDDREVEIKVLDAITAWRDDLREYDAFDSASDSWVETIWRLRESEIRERFEYWFDDVVRSEEIDEVLLDYTKCFIRQGQFSNRATLAFVGYGREEILPAWANVLVAAFLEAELLFIQGESLNGDPTSSPHWGICPLGQQSAINLFLRGTEQGSINRARRAAHRVVEASRQALLENVPDSSASATIKENFEKMQLEIQSSIDEEVWDYSNEEFVQPLRQAISALPVADLAAVAKSLVELQALRQTTTAELGTVGGPIDVATISRDEGFRWIRHKSTDSKF
jgi:hypothetical protein